MERPGEKLKRIRERLKLTFRDVEQASQLVAVRRNSDEFSIALSRLADIENKGTTPTIYRIYTLCAIYRLNFSEVVGWYGAPVDDLSAESLHLPLKETHLLQNQLDGPVTVPEPKDCEIDLAKTTFLSHVIRKWGKSSLSFLNGAEMRAHRYGFIGLDDWSMHPVLHPGALVIIDEGRRKIANNGWTNEFDRPIYFFERRSGYCCGWASMIGTDILIQPHPSSNAPPVWFEGGVGIDVIGQVTGIAMTFEPKPAGRIKDR